MPVQSEGGRSKRWQLVVGLLRETREVQTVSHGNSNEVELQIK